MKAFLARAVVGCCCLLAGWVVSADEQSNGNVASPGKAGNDTARQQQHAGEKHEDILDRVFSPLDEAVSDINRDLNKGDGKATAEANE